MTPKRPPTEGVNVLRTLALVAFALGALLLAGAIGLVLASQGGAGESGFDDLVRVAGSLMLGLAAAGAFGLHLLLNRKARSVPPAWETGISLAGAALGLVAAAWVGLIAFEGGNMALLVVVTAVVALALSGLVSGARSLRHA